MRTVRTRIDRAARLLRGAAAVPVDAFEYKIHHIATGGIYALALFALTLG